jgi:hypothetical protein
MKGQMLIDNVETLGKIQQDDVTFKSIKTKTRENKWRSVS